jgi:uncharacterized membrane protein YeiH
MPVPFSPDLFAVLDQIGTAVFAISGALVAAEKRQTPVTFAFFAAATAVGGGTMRDLLIGAPVFWVRDNRTLAICLASALAVWLFGRAPRALPWCDALGLVAYAVFGTDKALAHGIAPLPAAVMGMMTATAGGVIRDVLAERPSILLRPEVYVAAAGLSATTYALLSQLAMDPEHAALVAVGLGFALRAGAIIRGWDLPVHGGPAA